MLQEEKRQSGQQTNKLKEEEWKDISGYEGRYQASTFGRIRSIDRIVVYKNGREYNKKGKILSFSSNKVGEKASKGYFIVSLGGGTKFRVHVLILETFHSKRPLNMVCDHIDRNNRNNNIDNLRWVTPEENNKNKNRPQNYRRPYSDIRKKISQEIGSREAIAIKYNISKHMVTLIKREFKTSKPSKKLTPAQRDKVINTNTTSTELAKEFNCSRGCINRIRRKDAKKR